MVLSSLYADLLAFLFHMRYTYHSDIRQTDRQIQEVRQMTIMIGDLISIAGFVGGIAAVASILLIAQHGRAVRVRRTVRIKRYDGRWVTVTDRRTDYSR